MRAKILVLALLLPVSGCLGAAAAGVAYGYIKYNRNEAQQDFKSPVGAVWRASLEALEGRGYTLPGGVQRRLREDQDVAGVDGDGFWLSVKEYPGSRTRLIVRVGMFESEENQRKAKLLIESVARRL